MVSLHRAGRLPANAGRQMAVNDLTIAVPTAGELWKWALARRWGGVRRAGLELFSRPGADPQLTLNRRDFADFADHDGLVLLGG